jgi:hypothetical protein
MPDTPNYNESTISGQSWQRVYNINIDNPLTPAGQPPAARVLFNEQMAYVFGDKVVTSFVDKIVVNFDITNPKHLAVYMALDEVYQEERALRDARNNPPPVDPPVDPPPVDPPA